MARRLRKQDWALWILFGWLASFGVVPYSLFSGSWNTLVWSLGTVIAVPSWLIVTKSEALCGVRTKKGHPCPNQVDGLIFGCGSGNHTWLKVLARIGFGRLPLPAKMVGAPALASKAGGSDREGDEKFTAQVVQVRIVETRKDAIITWLAVISTTCAIGSFGTDVIGLFK